MKNNLTKQAELVAQKLSARFLEEGNYAAASSMKGSSLGEMIPAAASAHESDFVSFFEEAGFASLSVQSVGFEDGCARTEGTCLRKQRV